jgi:hypothetical protein
MRNMKDMKDMNLNELSTSRLIELLATVSFRIMAFQFALLTFFYLFLFVLDRNYLVNSNLAASYRNHAIQVYLMEITFRTVTAVVLFVLSGPLARLICRGLFQTSTNNNATN